MKLNFLILVIITLIVGSCANQVKNENIIEQEYKFGFVIYHEYKKNDNSGDKVTFGKIDFKKNSITVEMNIDGQVEAENFSIKTVTYDNSPNELKYRTNKGDFTVNLSNDTITEVALYTGSFSTTFRKAKENTLIISKLPIPIDVPFKDWKRIEIKAIGTIDLSPKLEIQAGKYKIKNQAYKDGSSRKCVPEIN